MVVNYDALGQDASNLVKAAAHSSAHINRNMTGGCTLYTTQNGSEVKVRQSFCTGMETIGTHIAIKQF